MSHPNMPGNPNPQEPDTLRAAAEFSALAAAQSARTTQDNTYFQPSSGHNVVPIETQNLLSDAAKTVFSQGEAMLKAESSLDDSATDQGYQPVIPAKGLGHAFTGSGSGAADYDLRIQNALREVGIDSSTIEPEKLPRTDKDLAKRGSFHTGKTRVGILPEPEEAAEKKEDSASQ